MSKGQKLDVSAAQLWVVLARSYRALEAKVEASIAELGLVLGDFMVLEALLHKGPLTISEIQRKVLLASGSMTAAVDRVERKGCVVRKATADDRRAKVIELTPVGRRTIEAAYAKHAKDLEVAMAALSGLEKKRLYGPLKKLGLAAANDQEE